MAQKLSGTKTSQDVFGVFEHPGWQAADILAKDAVFWHWKRCRTPAMWATPLRSAAALALTVCCSPRGARHPLPPKHCGIHGGSRAAAGGPVQDLPQALQQLRARGVLCLAAALYHSRPLDEAPQSYPDGLCAVIGSEGRD